MIQLGAQIFALEEEADEKDRKLQELEGELDGIDKELEEKQRNHEEEIKKLKDVSRKSLRPEKLADNARVVGTCGSYVAPE